MNKIYSKNIPALLTAAILAVGGLVVNTPQAYADIPGRYLTADLGSADLSGIASKYPTLFWGALIVTIIFCIGYGVHYLIIRKEKSV